MLDFSFDFDLVCDRLYSLAWAGTYDSRHFTVAFPFMLLLSFDFMHTDVSKMHSNEAILYCL